eukprot:Em0017g729a
MKISFLAVFLAVLVAIASAGGNGYYGGRYNSRGYGKMRTYNAHTKWDSSNRCLRVMAEIEETVDDGSDCEDLVEEAYAYLVYPECVSETKKRVIRRKAAKLTISVEGELLYKHKQGKEKSLEERQKILLACHIDSTSGHMVKAPWYMVGIDFIGPLSPVAKDGSRYILTISDYFTKWVEVVPTVNKMASTVASSLFKIFMRMGLPRVLLSDNGSEFCNALNDQLSEILGIKRRLTTPYHPQANGLDERFNQTLQNMLVKYVDMWSHYLDTCAFAYNTSRHDSTKYTPFMLMFGRRATLPIDVELERLLLLVLWQALILLKMIQIVTKEANLKTIHHPVIVPIKMTVLKLVALTVVALYWRIVQFLLNEIPFVRMQFPTIDGWQSTLLAQNNLYLPAKMDAIQIHIVSDSHWVTSARLGGTVTLFDCRKVGSHISSTLTHQLCQVYRTSICESAGNSFLAVNVATVQKQRGSDDCGVFAIAFALHAALGHCLEEFEFDQATMRDHLLKCYTTRNITSFPTKKVKRASHTLIMNIDVFCSCQRPDTYGDMMQCGLCEQWFHIKLTTPFLLSSFLPLAPSPPYCREIEGLWTEQLDDKLWHIKEKFVSCIQTNGSHSP